MPVSQQHGARTTKGGTLKYSLLPDGTAGPSNDTRHASNIPVYDNSTDIATSLIGYWFKYICPMWSTFDSEVNFNRRIALDCCTSSKPVFFTLQAMSAAHLSHSEPFVLNLPSGLMQQAMAAIQESMAGAMSDSGPIAIDLVFAVFALGTSSHWTGSSALGESLLTYARTLLKAWKSNEQATNINTFLYAYFRQALTYWQMLHCITDCDTTFIEYHHPTSAHATGTSEISPLGPEPLQNAEGTRPNSWCGVSGEVIAIFGKVMSLCVAVSERHKRGSRCRRSTHTHNADTEVKLARQYRQFLESMDFDAKLRLEEQLGFSLQTQDAKTPLSHLIHIAEAYRQAALLHLFLTFDDLELELSSSVQTTSSNQSFSQTVLNLIGILETVPLDSGSRCLQPILYISAAAGLRLSPSGLSHFHGTAKIGRSIASEQELHDISRARDRILEKLSVLQLTLPSRPLGVAIKLVKAIWSHYDDTVGNGRFVHWLDVMRSTRLQTLFR